MSGSTPELTELQAKAWPEAVADLQNHHSGLPERIGSWDVIWRDEVRPGRGHDIDARYCDGEVFAQITIDVYGHGEESIAELSWLHASADEECGCERCQAWRDGADV